MIHIEKCENDDERPKGVKEEDIESTMIKLILMTRTRIPDGKR